MVVPRAGTWIETDISTTLIKERIVVPRAGTWIETAARRSEKPTHIRPTYALKR